MTQISYNPIKMKLTVFEEPVFIENTYHGKLILEITKHNAHIVEPAEILTFVSTPRELFQRYQDVNSGLWMDATPASLFESHDKRIMGCFIFKRILPLHTNGKRNELVTSVKGHIVFHPEHIQGRYKNSPSNTILFNEPNILIEVISISKSSNHNYMKHNQL